MTKQILPMDISLANAAKAFTSTVSTESGEHIKPLHQYLATRLAIEGGFLPEDISPTPPLKSEIRSGSWYLSFSSTTEDSKEQVVLGALKSKRIDIVVAKERIGPLLAISVKGTIKAFRNLVNRTEEAIGDCANIHIMYPGLVYGFISFLKATESTGHALKPNDILLDQKGDILPSVRDYARILEALSGRVMVRNDYSKYEAVGMVLLKVKSSKGESPVLNKFPELKSSLHIDAFFSNLYRTYDIRFPYTYTDPGIKHLQRVAWHPESPALVSLKAEPNSKILLGYSPRESGD